MNCLVWIPARFLYRDLKPTVDGVELDLRWFHMWFGIARIAIAGSTNDGK